MRSGRYGRVKKILDFVPRAPAFNRNHETSSVTTAIDVVPRHARHAEGQRATPAATASEKVARLSLRTAGILLVAVLIDAVAFGQPKWLVAIVLILYMSRLVLAAKTIADPVVLLMGFASVYCAVPLLTAEPYSEPTYYLPTSGAAWIYFCGTTAMLIAVGLSNRALKARPINPVRQPTLHFAGALAAIISIVLSAAYIALYGRVGGDLNYAESFTVRLNAGSGALLLAVPFAAAGVCLSFCSGRRLSASRYAMMLAPYAMLFLAHGQRKFLIFPIIFVAAMRFRVKNARRLAIMAALIVPAFAVFQYLGYSRTQQYSLEEAASSAAVGDFLNAQGDAMGGEAVPVFATAAAAHEQLVAPLPFGGDYLLAPLMAVPQFLLANIYVPLNVRFAFWWKPDQAADGAGWGFSFFGEAYLVGGYIMVALMSAAMVFLFRYIYVKGLGSGATGTWAAVSLSMLPYVFWFQRNALGYLIREFGYQVIIIIITVGVAKLLMRFFLPRR